VDEVQLRQVLLNRVNRLAARLPNGLLQRLVDDAEFFHNWNMKKRKARSSARIAQQNAWMEKAEDKRWKQINR